MAAPWYRHGCSVVPGMAAPWYRAWLLRGTGSVVPVPVVMYSYPTVYPYPHHPGTRPLCHWPSCSLTHLGEVWHGCSEWFTRLPFLNRLQYPQLLRNRARWQFLTSRTILVILVKYFPEWLSLLGMTSGLMKTEVLTKTEVLPIPDC